MQLIAIYGIPVHWYMTSNLRYIFHGNEQICEATRLYFLVERYICTLNNPRSCDSDAK